MIDEYKTLQESCKVYQDDYMKKIILFNSEELNQKMKNKVISVKSNDKKTSSG